MTGAACPDDFKEAVDALKRSLLPARGDFFDAGVFGVTVIESGDDIRLILGSPHKSDTRRREDPLTFRSAPCFFCGPKGASSWNEYQLNLASNILVRNKIQIGLQYPKQCGPEPTVEAFVEMLQLAFEVRPHSILTVVNLYGSGASVPQHFHTQLVPLYCRQDESRKQRDIASLLENIRLGTQMESLNHDKIHIQEIVAPMWGCEIRFDSTDYGPHKIGQMLYKAIHGTRYHSQLRLSYNVYIHSGDPSVVTIFFREVYKECPFQRREVLDLIAGIADTKAIERMHTSDNTQWRWGWLECIGGLPARDSYFADTNVFDAKFWKSVYDFMTLDEKYRRPVWRQVKTRLTELLDP
jgi:hypothetical protein